MRFVIVTGMSGAGKSHALKILEDFGFYCVDNLPLVLFEQFSAWAAEQDKYDKVALSIDIRNGGDMAELAEKTSPDIIAVTGAEILFLDASDECIIKRFKETRRSHPLERDAGKMESCIALERELLSQMRAKAKYLVDTSYMLTKELRSQLDDIILGGRGYKNLNITILSFGFKYGIPSEADLVFDVRFLPNPFYVDELKELTGNDRAVSDYVKASKVTEEFLERLKSMISFLLPNYVAEGKNQLVIAVGCTGGKHRSVTVANELYAFLDGQDYGLKLEHREL